MARICLKARPSLSTDSWLIAVDIFSQDPHDSTRGFFFAHVGWLLLKKHPDVVKAGAGLDFSDLERDPVVVVQRKLDPIMNFFMCFALPVLIAQAGWGEEFWPALLVPGFLRYVL